MVRELIKILCRPTATKPFSFFLPFLWFTVFDRPSGCIFLGVPWSRHHYQTNNHIDTRYSAHCSAWRVPTLLSRTDLHVRVRLKYPEKSPRFIFMPFRYSRGSVWKYYAKTRVSSGQFLLGSSSSFSCSRAVCSWSSRVHHSLSLSLSFQFMHFLFFFFPIFSLTWMMTMMSPPLLITLRSANHEEEHSTDRYPLICNNLFKSPSLSPQRERKKILGRKREIPVSSPYLPTKPSTAHLHDRVIYIRPRFTLSFFLSRFLRRKSQRLYNTACMYIQEVKDPLLFFLFI